MIRQRSVPAMFFVIVIAVFLISVVIFVMLRTEKVPDSVTGHPDSMITANALSGKWTSDEVSRGPGVTLIIHLAFGGDGKLILTADGFMNGAPVLQPTSEYRYEVAEDGTVLVTLLSKSIDGRELSKPEERVPEAWHYRILARDTLHMEKPGPNGPLVYRLRKDR